MSDETLHPSDELMVTFNQNFKGIFGKEAIECDSWGINEVNKVKTREGRLKKLEELRDMVVTIHTQFKLLNSPAAKVNFNWAEFFLCVMKEDTENDYPELWVGYEDIDANLRE